MNSPTTQQILAPSGASVWSREECDFIHDIEPGGKTIVEWHDTKWFLKFKDQSTNEVIGYQLAEFLNLPVQPWLAVEVGRIEETGLEKPEIGILIQEWIDLRCIIPLEYPAFDHRVLVGKALALACLVSNDMEWMTNTAASELRLIDLECCGPWINFSGRPLIDEYLNCVRAGVSRNYTSAAHDASAFSTALAQICGTDLTRVIDLSGHSRALDVTNAVTSFLYPAQKLLSCFSDGLCAGS